MIAVAVSFSACCSCLSCFVSVVSPTLVAELVEDRILPAPPLAFVPQERAVADPRPQEPLEIITAQFLRAVFWRKVFSTI